MMGGGGERSLWSVCRKDCGKQGMEHPWSPALGLGGGGPGDGTDVQAAGMGVGGFMGNPRRGQGAPSMALALFFPSWTVARASPPEWRLILGKKTFRQSGSRPACKDFTFPPSAKPVYLSLRLSSQVLDLDSWCSSRHLLRNSPRRRDFI